MQLFIQMHFGMLERSTPPVLKIDSVCCYMNVTQLIVSVLALYRESVGRLDRRFGVMQVLDKGMVRRHESAGGVKSLKDGEVMKQPQSIARDNVVITEPNEQDNAMWSERELTVVRIWSVEKGRRITMEKQPNS
jgi:hypothetical protein